MKYVVTATNHEEGYVDVEYEDKSWARIYTPDGMTKCDWENSVLAYSRANAPPPSVPDFITVGFSGDLSVDKGGVSEPSEEPTPEWFLDRQSAYGTAESQIEFIVENGLEAWQEHVRMIKELFPKDDEKKVY